MKKKQPLPKFEMIVAGSVLAVILGIALVIGYYRNKDVKEKQGAKEAENQIFERNIRLAQDELQKAIPMGTNFVLGKDVLADVESKLRAPFENNPKVYNVLYNRDFKDRRKDDKQESYPLIKDIDHTRSLVRINTKDKEKNEQDLEIYYGLARENDKWVSVVVAKKNIKPRQEDPVNLGGSIVMIVRAEEDETFRKARDKQAPPESKPADTSKPPEAKPADTNTKTPTDNKAPVPEIKEKPPENKAEPTK